MQIKVISKPNQELISSLVDLENDILPPFHQRCALLELCPGVTSLLLLPREIHCSLDSQELKCKGMPTAAAVRHNVRRIKPEEQVPPGHSVIIIFRKEGKVLCGLFDPEFSLPSGSQLFQVASEGTLNMLDLVRASVV